MNWYLTKIVYQIICGNGAHTAQFDEQLRAITACSEEEALEKARSIGHQEEEVFYNQKEQLVQWKFINVSALYRLGDFTDGAEIYSTITEADDSVSYTRLVHHKAASIRERITQGSFTLI